jgi:hypothetical protein
MPDRAFQIRDEPTANGIYFDVRSAETAAEFGKLLADDTEKWAKVVKFSGAKVD